MKKTEEMVIQRILMSKNVDDFNPFVNESHIQCESRSLSHWITRTSSHFVQLRPSRVDDDSTGSIRAVTNQWGSPLYMFDYDVFGTPLQDRPERFHYGYTGKEYDNWTGLYNYGFRDYAPLCGRFTTVDPIQDGRNWYAYVNSDPVSWLDPWGLKGLKSGEDPAKSTAVNEKNDEKTARRMLYNAINFIITNAEEDEVPIANKLVEMMNNGKIQLDDVRRRYEKANKTGHGDETLGFFDPWRNTETGERRNIIVIDIENSIKHGQAELIDTLMHEGYHAVQSDRGLIVVDENNIKYAAGNTTYIELPAYNMGFRMYNKYAMQNNLELKGYFTYEQIERKLAEGHNR